jgi:ubiquinone/menaquinone biosynthesis C-methylase UbiE
MAETNQPDTSPSAEEKTALVQRRFGAVAQAYVTSAVHAQGHDLPWIVEAAALTGTEIVADVATGTGHTAFALAPYAREVIAIDITIPMLAEAQKLAVERQITNVRFLEGDAHALPLASNSVDLVTCRHSAHHFVQAARAAQEWTRVLKPGGRLILDDSISPEEPELDTFLHTIELLRDPSHVRNQRISEWLAILNAAGLQARLFRETGIQLDVTNWTQRMQTPPEDVERIEQLLKDASPLQREHFHIVQQDGQFSFLLPSALFIGSKKA